VRFFSIRVRQAWAGLGCVASALCGDSLCGVAGRFLIGLEIGLMTSLRVSGKSREIWGGGVVDERERDECVENEAHGIYGEVAVRRATRRNGTLARMIYYTGGGVF